MYSSESQVWGVAARAVSERIRARQEFATLRAELVAGALAICRGQDVPAMRALGGFSSVLSRLVDALPDFAREDCGSRLLAGSVASELRFDIPSMREEVQATLAREEGRTL